MNANCQEFSVCVHVCVCSVNLKTWNFPGGDAGNHSEESKAFPRVQPVDLLNFVILQNLWFFKIFQAVWPQSGIRSGWRILYFFLCIQIPVLAISKYSDVPSGSHHSYILKSSDVCMCVFLALVNVLTIFNNINKYLLPCPLLVCVLSLLSLFGSSFQLQGWWISMGLS